MPARRSLTVMRTAPGSSRRGALRLASFNVVADGFDAMPIGVAHECREVGLVVLRKELRLVDDVHARVHRGSEEPFDDISIRSAEPDMQFTRFGSPRGTDPERTDLRTRETDSVAVGVLGPDLQGRQKAFVKRATGRDVSNLNRNVVEQGSDADTSWRPRAALRRPRAVVGARSAGQFLGSDGVGDPPQQDDFLGGLLRRFLARRDLASVIGIVAFDH